MLKYTGNFIPWEVTLPFVQSINVPDDGRNGYWRAEHSQNWYHPGQPDRKKWSDSKYGTQDCVAAYPDSSGKYMWGDEWCMQQMNTLCQVNYGGLV